MTDRVAIVTGASRGIGRAISLKLAARGAQVIVNYRTDAAGAESVVREIAAQGGRAEAVQGDVRVAADAEGLVRHVVEQYQRVDVLVNNAGTTRDALLIRMTADEWDTVLDTNLRGAFLCIKACVRPMMKRRYGRIVNISSVSGITGNIGQANYSAAKSGLIGLTKTTAKELGSRGITVNAVAPGFVPTALTEDLAESYKARIIEATPLGRFGTAEEIANAVAFLASDEASYITGQVLAVDGGLAM